MQKTIEFDFMGYLHFKITESSSKPSYKFDVYDKSDVSYEDQRNVGSSLYRYIANFEVSKGLFDPLGISLCDINDILYLINYEGGREAVSIVALPLKYNKEINMYEYDNITKSVTEFTKVWEKKVTKVKKR